MTGYTVNTGSSKQFAEGWDRVFSGSKKAAKQPAKARKTKGARKRGKSGK